MARAHGRGSTTPTIPIGTVRGRRADAASFALAVLSSLAQAWALVGLGRSLGALLAAGSGATAPGATAPGAWPPLLLQVVLAAAVSGACQIVVEALSRTSAAREEGRLRSRLLAHLFDLGPARAADLRSGSTVSLLTDGAERVALYRQTFLAPTAAAFASPALVLALLAVVIDPLPCLVLLVAVVLVPGFIIALHLKVRRSSSGSRRARTRLAGAYLDAIQGLTTLTLARAAARTAADLRRAGEDNRRAVMGLLAGNQLVILVTDCLFSLFFIAAAAGMALIRLRAGAIDVGDALALVLTSFVLLEPLDRVGAFFYVGMGGLANQRAMRRVLGARRAPGAAPDDGAPAVPPGGRDDAAPALSLRRVTASWAGNGDGADGARGRDGRAGRGGRSHPAPGRGAPDGAPGRGGRTGRDGADGRDGAGDVVLSDVDLTVARGEHVALIGPSGAGKSTLLALASGDLLPAAGTVRVGGIASTAATQDEVRAAGALVAQSTWLFAGTIADNLRLADPTATPERMWRALERANLAQEVRLMPAGLDTVVGENGLGLSGGQAQRVSLARAFLADRPLLLLDEPTSQVDLAGEAQIIEAIDRLAAGRTVLTVSHRAGALTGADRVIRVADGALTPVGPEPVAPGPAGPEPAVPGPGTTESED